MHFKPFSNDFGIAKFLRKGCLRELRNLDLTALFSRCKILNNFPRTCWFLPELRQSEIRLVRHKFVCRVVGSLNDLL